jgi:hypothetical protein
MTAYSFDSPSEVLADVQGRAGDEVQGDVVTYTAIMFRRMPGEVKEMATEYSGILLAI